ncbi:TPA: hypothetical protein PFE14_004504 [Kluyvera ascorbata]|nr:hypothetical protein [Kluyvera ascorbata]
MSAGTITLANNSNAVAGDGTAFTTELAAGDFIVVTTGGVTYTLPVKSIESDTALTLARNYNGPAVTAGAWTAMPRDTLNRISAQIAADTAYAIRQRVLEIDNWYQLLEVNGDVTIKMADGSSYTGPSWLSIKDTLSLIDIDAVTALANQVRTDAQQVGADKQAAEAAASSAKTDASAAASANSTAQTAKQDAETAAGTATDKATESKNAAEDAQTAKAAAEQAAAAVQPENLLQNSKNLDDLTDKPEARQNLDVFSKEEIADMLPGYLGQIDWQEMRTALEPGTAPRDGQEVDQTGIFADLYAKGVAGKLPTCTEIEWQADPLKRGCYVLESSPGKMRLPDDNGVQPGSLKIPVKVGDGGDVAKSGMMGESAIPNFTASWGATPGGGTINWGFVNNIRLEGAMKATRGQGSSISSVATAQSNDYLLSFTVDPSVSSSVYKNNITQIEPNRTKGCWTVRYATKATNGGSIDALALATAIADGDAALSARIIAMNARVDYALLDFGTMALSERKVIANPFGNNQPVIVKAEVLRTDLSPLPQPRWGETGWIYASNGYGVLGSYMEGEGIVVQCGGASMANTSTQTGSPHQITATTQMTNLPVRVHVWKIKQ